jgi:hypothetical protein
MNGYKYQENRFKNKFLTLTIFSAPNYCDTYKNRGSVGLIAVITRYNLEWENSTGSIFANLTSLRAAKLHEYILVVNAFCIFEFKPDFFQINKD